MANTIITPNMGLPNPVPNIDPGPDYAFNNQACFNVLDQHNHTPGSGVQIPPAGLNINSALPFNRNPATNLQATIFTQQSAFPTNNSLWVGTDGNLYFNDGAGDPSIKITAGGTVNATTSGISSGTATASFIGGVLVVNAAPNTPANIQAGSILLGNNSVGSNYLTLSPPSSMGSNITETLPTIPPATSFMQMDASGNMTASIPVSQGITASNIASATITGTQIASATITGSNIALNTVTQGNIAIRSSGSSAGNYAISSSCGFFATTSASPVAVTNLSVSLATLGNPVMVMVQPDGTAQPSTTGSYIGGINQDTSIWIYRDGSVIYEFILFTAGSSFCSIPMLQFLDVPSAASHTYAIYAAVGAANAVQFAQMKLVAFEIK